MSEKGNEEIILQGIGCPLFRWGEKGLEIFVLKELKEKIFRPSGQFSFGLETIESKENKEKTLERLFLEEYGLSANEVNILFFLPGEHSFFPNYPNIFTSGACAYFLGNPNRVFVPQDDESVEVVGWWSLDDFLNLESSGNGKFRKDALGILKLIVADPLFCKKIEEMKPEGSPGK